ncbi:MAG: LAGLIDADG family homing endonuclease, partial [Candidatus Diapherotrites archaeon]
KPIREPQEMTPELAELVGAYLGDGGLTEDTMCIHGDPRYDMDYFSYLQNLVRKIFELETKIRIDGPIQAHVEIKSVKLCRYFRDQLGFQFGDKIRNQSAIPYGIMEKDELFFACLRGLMDTDGSVSKDNHVLSIRFANRNKALLGQLAEKEKKLKLFSFYYEEQIGTKCFSKMLDYFETVGSSNPRHIVRFLEFLKGNTVKKHDVLPYYEKYAPFDLPYKLPEFDKAKALDVFNHTIGGTERYVDNLANS